MSKHTDFITVRCEMDHRYMTEEFYNLQQAIQTVEAGKCQFANEHRIYGKLTIIPIKGKSHITIKCTECTFIYID